MSILLVVNSYRNVKKNSVSGRSSNIELSLKQDYKETVQKKSFRRFGELGQVHKCKSYVRNILLRNHIFMVSQFNQLVLKRIQF